MIQIQDHVPLAPFTTFKIGRVARHFTIATTGETLVEALCYAQDHHLKACLLGGGSNILFADQGFDGLVIRLEMTEITQDGLHILVGAGAKLSDVIAFASEHSLAGMELMAGIPGTIGGATRGNAGAFGVETGSLIHRVTFLDTQTMEVHTFSREECGFAYRQSIFKKQASLCVLSVELALQEGNALELARISQETIAKREAKHPQQIQCAGSFFMNPVVTDAKLLEEFAHETGVASRDGKLPAGWIIDHAGLRGKKVGGAQVSEIHPNYIVNTGNATAEDVLILASIVKQRVRTQLNIRLLEEVQLVGF